LLYDRASLGFPVARQANVGAIAEYKCNLAPRRISLRSHYLAASPGKFSLTVHWVRGYDEITWFGLQSNEYRANWLQYARVRNTDGNGFLEMPGGRTASSADLRWYYALEQDSACNRQKTARQPPEIRPKFCR